MIMATVPITGIKKTVSTIINRLSKVTERNYKSKGERLQK